MTYGKATLSLWGNLPSRDRLVGDPRQGAAHVGSLQVPNSGCARPMWAASIRGLAVVNPSGRQIGEAVAAPSAARKDR